MSLTEMSPAQFVLGNQFLKLELAFIYFTSRFSLKMLEYPTFWWISSRLLALLKMLNDLERHLVNLTIEILPCLKL